MTQAVPEDSRLSISLSWAGKEGASIFVPKDARNLQKIRNDARVPLFEARGASIVRACFVLSEFACKPWTRDGLFCDLFGG